MASQSIPYIEREAAEQFLQALDDSLTSESKSGVFNVWGIGGVGKSTLLGKVEERVAEKADCVRIYFGLTEGIDSPLGLMEKLFKGLVKADAWGFRSEFLELYQRYKDTLNQLETVPVKGRQVDEKQVKQVQTLVNLGVGLLQKGMPKDAAEAWGAVGKNAVAGAVAALSVKDEVGELLRSHKATKKDRELQELMLEPLPKLTAAFATNLRERGRARPVVLILDTYEKASQEMDDWLGRSLVGNQDLGKVRIVVAGRNRLVGREGWRKLRQDHYCLEETGLERFSSEQIQRYLHRIGIEDDENVRQIFEVTKGLPYYLNWIREKQERGQKLDFSQGNEEIIQLLSQGLSPEQQRVVQLAACCRRFNRQLIQLLLAEESLEFGAAVDPELDCFEWLKQQHFVESAQGQYQLDDVARNVFRQSLLEADEERFKAVQGALADYFVERSNGIVAVVESPRQKYQDEDWRRARSEYLYHLLLSRRKAIQLEFRSHLLEAQYFGQSSMTREPLEALKGEFALAEHPLLNGDSGTRQFLQQVEAVVDYGWWVLQTVPLDYEVCQQVFGLSKQAVDVAWGKVLEQPEKLQGLAQLAAYVYTSGRDRQSKQLQHLQQARELAKSKMFETDPVLSSNFYFFHLGMRFANCEAHDEAIDSYDKAVEIKSDLYPAWVDRGIALSKLGKDEAAFTSYDKALEIKPDFYLALANRGISLFALEKYEEALSDYNKVLEIRPEEAWTYYNRGILLSKLGQHEEALADYDTALKIQPDLYQFWANRGNTLSQLRQHEEALASYDTALKIRPNYDTGWVDRGISSFALGQHDEALSDCDKALGINPQHHQAWYLRAALLSRLGKQEEAIASYDRAIDIQPDDHEAWFNRGGLLSQLGHEKRAVASYNQAIEIKPDYYQAYFHRGVSLSRLEERKEAISSYEQALEIEPAHSEAWYYRGQLHWDLTESLDSFDKAIEIEPNNHIFWRNRGAILNNMGLYAEALVAAKKSIELEPSEAHQWFVQGYALNRTGDFKAAIVAFDQALKFNPSDSYGAWREKGYALFVLVRFEEAIASYDKTIEIQPNDHKAWVCRGDIYRQLGQQKQALANLNQAIELKPDYAWAIATRGQTYAQLQQYETALQDLDRAIEIDPDYTWAISYRGELYLRLQRYPEALAIFNQILDKETDCDWTHYLRALALAKTPGVCDNQPTDTPGLIKTPGVSTAATADLAQAIQLAQAKEVASLEKIQDWNNHFNLALYHLAAGQPPKADRLYQTALTTAPTWAIAMAQRDLRGYLSLFPEDKAAQNWHKQLQQGLPEEQQ